jgi:tetratricopeptide (TPR) repeat protein
MRLHHWHACIGTEIGDFELSYAQWQAARGHFDHLVGDGHPEATTEDIEAYLGGIANSLNGLGRNTEAINTYREAFKYAPKDDVDSPYEVNICRTQWSNGELDEAAARLTKLIKLREMAKGEKDDSKSFV